MPTLRLPALLLLLAACDFPLPRSDEPGAKLPSTLTPAPVGEAVNEGARVGGFLWDLEAYAYRFLTCAQPCELPPITVPGTPLFDWSQVKGAQVHLFDPASATPRYAAEAATGANGTFRVEHVETRVGPPYFPLLTAAGAAQAVNQGPPGLPPGKFLPTLSLRPVATGNSYECLMVSSLAASDAGVVEAVAKYLTAQGTVTTAADLVDPAKTGGLALWFLYMPGPSSLRVPAFGTAVKASAGQVLPINWAPPGVGPAPLQSARGFFVDAAAPVSAMGITAVVLPPGPPAPVQFTAQDSATDMGRPWAFPPLPAMVVPPGVVSVGELPGLLPGGDAPPSWLCLQ